MFTENKNKDTMTLSFNPDLLSGLINFIWKYAITKILKGKEHYKLVSIS